MKGRFLKKKRSFSTFLFFGVFVCLLLISSSYAVVLHPDGEPPADWPGRPDPNVIGGWNVNGTLINWAGSVVISPNHILTIRHAGGGVSSTVKINSVTYHVDQIFNEPTGADLRVIRLLNADLTTTVPLYTEQDEIDKEFVVGGYGDGRGGILKAGIFNKTYGYTWDGMNTTLRFGTNKVEEIADVNSLGYVSNSLVVDFDGLGEGDSTIFEAAAADHDSGSGAFIESGGQWKLAGLGLGVSRFGESRFRDPDQIMVPPMPDINVFIRISTYNNWIQTIIQNECSTPLKTDFNNDCEVNIHDLIEFSYYWLDQNCDESNNFCDGADFHPDGHIDLKDLSAFALDWQFSE